MSTNLRPDGGRDDDGASADAVDPRRWPRPAVLRVARSHPFTGRRPQAAASSDSRLPELRFDRQTGQWVIIAALRQDRTYKPAADQCPLCPSPSGLTSEIPAPDYDVVVFENRFPSLTERGRLHNFRYPTATASSPRRATAAASLSASAATTLGRSPNLNLPTHDWSSTPGDTAPPN